MAFDGVTLQALKKEIDEKVLGARVDKIYQPSSSELVMGIRSLGKNYKLLFTANASNTKIHFTEQNFENPPSPPLFCMVMRKHLQSGKIIKTEQPLFDRIIVFYIESLNEMGDYTKKKLIFEIMGKHSNIILTDEDDTILEAIRHVGRDISSVREILPGRKYTAPPSQEKRDPQNLGEEFFDIVNKNKEEEISKIIYKNYTGISPVSASEICFRAGLSPSEHPLVLSFENITALFNSFKTFFRFEDFPKPSLIFEKKGKCLDCVPFHPYHAEGAGYDIKSFSSMSEAVEVFYSKRDTSYRLNQKTADIKKLLSQNIERCMRKAQIQSKTLKDIENRDTLRLKGELLTANIYALKKGMESIDLQNFYSEKGESITIKLDPNKTPSENTQSYFKKYAKEKRTFEALQEQIVSNEQELNYLQSVLNCTENCTSEADVAQIRSELSSQGYVKEKKGKREMKKQSRSLPLSFTSSDGFTILVGKNNIQNDELTMKKAGPKDMWLHTKNIPGSHVIIFSEGGEIPDTTITEAAILAAYYSSGRGSSKIPVDYTLKKYVKKPAGAKPGFVIYETNKTALVVPDEEKVRTLEENNARKNNRASQ